MIFASTACLGAPDLWNALAAFDAAGLKRIELGSCRLDPTVDLPTRLREHGRDYLVHNYFPPPADPFVLNLASPDDVNRGRSIEHAKDAIDLAAEVGSSFYSVHAGFVLDPVDHADGRFVFPGGVTAQDRAAAVELFDQSIVELLEHADTRGINLLVENNVCLPEHRGSLLLQDAHELEAFFETFSTSRLGLLLDTGHLLVTASTFGFNTDDFVTRVAPWIAGFHVSENDGRRDSHLPIALDGWTASLIARPEFFGVPVCVEAHFDSADQVARHVASLSAFLHRYGEPGDSRA